MSYDISLPKITATSTTEQIKELQSYIYQMVGELNWALNTIDTSSSENNYIIEGVNGVIKELNDNVDKKDGESPLETFNRIKALIIKSADIVNAYEEKFKVDLSGYFVADSDYGTFKETTESYLELSDKKLGVGFSKVESIENSLTKADGTLIEVESAINASASELSADFDSKVTVLGKTVTDNHAEFIASAEGLQIQINSINREIDGSMYVYNVMEEPTLTNYPAWDFTKNIPCDGTVKVSDSLKFEYKEEYLREHLRDIAFYEDEGLTYRFSVSDGTFFWNPVSDTEFGIAMNKIADLEVTADNLKSKYDAQQIEIIDGKQQIVSNTSKITQTAEKLETEVTARTTADGDLSSRISQTAKGISLTVGDQVGREIGISIGVTKEDGTTSTDSKTIVLNGDVVFVSQLKDGTTVISGNNIRTGTIDADLVNVKNLKASSIKAGELKVGENVSITKDYIKSLNLEVGNEIIMGDDATIGWDKVTDKSEVITDSNKTTKITKDYIESLHIKADSVDAEKITGTTISGKTISGGTISGATISGNTISGGTISGTAISGGTVNGATITSTSNNSTTTIKEGSIKATDGGNTTTLVGSGTTISNMLQATSVTAGGVSVSDLTVDNVTSLGVAGLKGTQNLAIDAPTVTIPALIQSGTLSVGNIPQSVKFDTAFRGIPNVVASFSTKASNNPTGATGTIRVFAKTAEGFVIVAPSCSTAQNVSWIATI